MGEGGRKRGTASARMADKGEGIKKEGEGIVKEGEKGCTYISTVPSLHSFQSVRVAVLGRHVE